jgi:hypothetical protein
MEKCSESLEKLISKAEIYSKTTFEICKYNTIYRSADLLSSIAVRLVLIFVFVLFSLFLNIFNEVKKFIRRAKNEISIKPKIDCSHK